MTSNRFRLVFLAIVLLCASFGLGQTMTPEYLRAISTIYTAGATGKLVKEWCDERVPALKLQNAQVLEVWRTRMDLPISLAVVSAVQTTSAQPVVQMPSLGGSLPLSIISETLNIPTITVPIANYDNNQHAENENIRLQNLWDGIEIFASLMTMKG